MSLSLVTVLLTFILLAIIIGLAAALSRLLDGQFPDTTVVKDARPRVGPWRSRPDADLEASSEDGRPHRGYVVPPVDQVTAACPTEPQDPLLLQKLMQQAVDAADRGAPEQPVLVREGSLPGQEPLVVAKELAPAQTAALMGGAISVESPPLGPACLQEGKKPRRPHEPPPAGVCRGVPMGRAELEALVGAHKGHLAQVERAAAAEEARVKAEAAEAFRTSLTVHQRLALYIKFGDAYAVELGRLAAEAADAAWAARLAGAKLPDDARTWFDLIDAPLLKFPAPR